MMTISQGFLSPQPTAVTRRDNRATSIDGSTRRVYGTPADRFLSRPHSIGSSVVATIKKPHQFRFPSQRLEARGADHLGQHQLLSNSTTLTPILTPRVDRSRLAGSISPSREISETFTSLASSTGQKLEVIWNEVGYTPEHRAAQLSDMLMKIRVLCDDKVVEERSVADMFRQSIAEAREEIYGTCTALKVAVNPTLLPVVLDPNKSRLLPHRTLMEELATLESALEDVRNTANEARADLEECRDFLLEAHDALGIDMVRSVDYFNSIAYERTIVCSRLLIIRCRIRSGMT
jgi:hypothetical protein